MKTGSKFPDLLTVRAEGTDHPPAPDRKRLTRQSKRKGKRSRSRGGRGQQQGQGPDDLQRMWCGKVNTLLSFAFFPLQYDLMIHYSRYCGKECQRDDWKKVWSF